MKLYLKAKEWFKAKFVLVENWRQVLLRSYTVWMAVGAALLGGIEYWHADVLSLLPIVAPFLPEKLAGALGSLLTAAIPLARIKKQISVAIAEAKKVTVVDINVDVSGNPKNLADVKVQVERDSADVTVVKS